MAAGAPPVLVIGTGAFGSSFASARNFSNIALDSSYLVLIAVGMTFVIISGGIDLAVGSTIALTGVVTALAINAGASPTIALAAGISVGGLVGVAPPHGHGATEPAVLDAGPGLVAGGRQQPAPGS